MDAREAERDQLIDLYPSMKSHLAVDAPNVHNRDFENAVIKFHAEMLTPA